MWFCTVWRDVRAVVKQRQISIRLNKAAVSDPMIFMAPVIEWRKIMFDMSGHARMQPDTPEAPG